ncbi:hypothetical protein KI387_011541, partial [Taxus chinensis]
FKYVNQACCGIGKFGGFFICMPESPVCRKEQYYLFWDAFHPTDRMLKQMADLLWENVPPYNSLEAASVWARFFLHRLGGSASTGRRKGKHGTPGMTVGDAFLWK